MDKFWKRRRTIEYHIDRIESSYGNIMVRGWAVSLEEGHPLEISVRGADGEVLDVYQEHLVREDVNQMFGKEPEYPSGFHLLIDRAVVNTSVLQLIFDNGVHHKQEKIQVGAGNAVTRYLRTHKKSAGETELDYDAWLRRQVPDRAERKRQRSEVFEYAPVFSIVIPLYNTPQVFLKEIIDSVMNQTYPNVELCLADGSTSDEVGKYIKSRYRKETRIRYRRLKENKGISENTNAAIKMSSGEFIVFADHDDVLTCDAVYEMVKALNQDREIDVIYTDEDKVNRNGTMYFGPHFKPDFNWELLRCNNYICHLFAVKREIVKQTGLLNPAYDGAQDYDFVLRCCEKAEHIHHIPKVLYHWRTHPASTAGNPESKEYAFEAGRQALGSHYRRCGVRAVTEHTGMRGRYRTRYAIEGNPRVTILIPNKDHAEDLRRCVDSIREKTTYENYEILIIENNSTEEETFEYYRSLTGGCVFASEADQEMQGDIRIITWEGPFDYAGIHNFAVPYARGQYLILLNNDTEIITENWIEEMLGICQKPGVGVVGAKLYYPDGTIQHAGVVLGLGGVAGHLYAGCPGDREGYMGRLVSVQEVSAVTAACMMTKKSVYEQAGGMSREFAVAYNDIDYCLKVQQAGGRVVFTPYAELYHYESKSRGAEDTAEKKERLAQEAENFRRKWGGLLEQGDPCYNPNLSLTKADCSLREAQ